MKTRNHNATLLWLTLVLCLFGILNMDAQFGNQPDRDDRFSNTIGFDPKNAFVGGKKDANGDRRNPAGLAFKGGLNINVDYWEWGMHLNTFAHVDYYAIGMSFHREFATFNLDGDLYNDGSTLAFLVGGEAQIAARYGLETGDEIVDWKADTREYFNYSLSAIVRWDRPWSLPGFIEAQGTFTHRSDIKDLWGDNSDYSAWDNPGGYIKIGFYFLEIFN